MKKKIIVFSALFIFSNTAFSSLYLNLNMIKQEREELERSRNAAVVALFANLGVNYFRSYLDKKLVSIQQSVKGEYIIDLMEERARLQESMAKFEAEKRMQVFEVQRTFDDMRFAQDQLRLAEDIGEVNLIAKAHTYRLIYAYDISKNLIEHHPGFANISIAKVTSNIAGILEEGADISQIMDDLHVAQRIRDIQDQYNTIKLTSKGYNLGLVRRAIPTEKLPPKLREIVIDDLDRSLLQLSEQLKGPEYIRVELEKNAKRISELNTKMANTRLEIRDLPSRKSYISQGLKGVFFVSTGYFCYQVGDKMIALEKLDNRQKDLLEFYNIK